MEANNQGGDEWPCHAPARSHDRCPASARVPGHGQGFGDQAPHQVGPEKPANEGEGVEDERGGDPLDLQLLDDVAPRGDGAGEPDAQAQSEWERPPPARGALARRR